MDEVYVRALELSRELDQFNATLRKTITQVDGSHEKVSPLWEDAMRRDYDRRWIPLQEEMKKYTEKVGPQYVGFLIQRLNYLNSYLHGHGS